MASLTTERTARNRFRTTLIVVCVLVAPFAAHAIWDQIEANRLRHVVDRLRSSGQPVDLRDQRWPLANDEAGAASRLYYAAVVLADGAFVQPGASPDRPGAPVGAQATKAFAAEEKAMAAVQTSIAADDRRVAELAALVERADTALMLVDRAASLRFERFRLRGAGDERADLDGDLIQVAKVNAIRADLRSLAGDGEGAAHALFSGVRLLRAMAPFGRGLCGASFGTLRLMLSRTTPSMETLDRLQAAYADVATDDGLARDLVLRRAAMIGSAWPTSGRPTFAQRIDSQTRWQDWSPGSLPFVAFRPLITHEFIRGLENMDETIAQMHKPWPEKLTTLPSGAVNFPGNPGAVDRSRYWSLAERLMRRTNIPMWLPAFARGMQSPVGRAARFVAQARVATAALAVERWRRAHDGTLPADLQSLVPGFMATVPLDPFTGRPLRFVKTADSYSIYSVGVDRVDNGGDIGEWIPDVAVPYERGTDHDIGIHLSVARRR